MSILNNMEAYIEQNDISPQEGLPQEVFLEVSSITPIPNVDLLLLNDKGKILLSWRDDIYYGKGWHLPGGCIRFKEKMLDRVHKTALKELGCDVLVDEEPIAIRDVIIDYKRSTLDDQNVRAHNVAVMFKCTLPHGCVIGEDYNEQIASAAGDSAEVHQSGELKWFSRIPKDILPVHSVYNDVFTKYGLMNENANEQTK